MNKDLLEDLITAPSGATGIRVMPGSIPNPAEFAARTVTNRSEAALMLQGHDIKMVVGKGKDDPFFQLNPPLSFQYMTEADIDPKTGRPRVMKQKGKPPKIVASRIARFTFRRTSVFAATSKMSAASWSVPAGPPAISGSCPAAEIFKSKRQYEIALGQGEVEQRPANKKDWICSYCITGDARVPVMGKGLLRLDEIVRRVGDGEKLEVLSDSGWTRVTNAWDRGPKETVHVQCTGGQQIRATPDHKILTTEGWVEASNLETGDRIVVSPPETGVGAWPSERDIPPIHVSGEEISRGSRKPDLPEKFDRKIGLFLGYMAGNGAVSWNEKYPNISLVVDSQDRCDLEELVCGVNQWIGSDAVVSEGSGISGEFKTGQSYKASERSRASIAWRKLCLGRLLDALKLDWRSPKEERRVPETIWDAPKEGVSGFLSGIFSTDGSVLQKHDADGSVVITLAAVSKRFLQDIQVLLLNFGIHSSICAYRKSNEERIAVGYKPLYKLDISSKEGVLEFRESIGLFCKRKAELLSKANTTYKKPWSSRRYAVVESVLMNHDEEVVYDIEVEHDSHRFVANGLVVSNCYAGKSNYMHRTSQYSQTIRWVWLRGMAQAHGIEHVADLMADALIAHLGNKKKREALGESTDFFRIHDSGDFTLSPDTYTMWSLIASHPKLRHIKFWAPTRNWVFPKFVELVRRSPPPENLAVRPSALHFGDLAPEIEGFDAGSTAHPSGSDPVQEGIAQWSCPAYEHNGRCAGAGGPKGEKDCRACWTYKDTGVSYRGH